MENQQLLVHTEQHEVDNRFYSFEVYKGLGFRNAQYDFNYTPYEQVVEIKAFSILVRETTVESNGSQTFDHVHFRYCTSRTGDFRTAITEMKEQCKNLREMESLMARLEKRFSVALDRDAQKVLKKQLGLYKPKPDWLVRKQKRNALLQMGRR